MQTIAARDIKRRGIGAFDELIQEGPVYVIKNDRPTYVIMTAEHFEDLVEDQHKAEAARISEALADVAAGNMRRVTADELLRQVEQQR